MEKISSVEIRDKFLGFFKDKDHMEIEDSSIIPRNDPTLLFINSGMAPIKNYFTGVEKPPYPRLCDVQPCIRTIDIDSIGDKHHLTSFQMLGSWSINNYFKEKAIPLAFEFLTERLNIPKEKLYVTVFSGDEEIGLPWDSESYEFWKKVGMPDEHIIKCSKEDNFWGPTAETGPCGPCTEIFYDTGEGEKYIPGGEFDTKKRYIEIWNAGVFMQLNKNADGTFSRLSFTSVDTGAGLERLAMVLGGYSTVYDTDLLRPIKEFIQNHIPCDASVPEKDILIMTDHLRTAALILSAKVAPSNEGRGYIPRKLIRRCMMIVAKNKLHSLKLLDVIIFILEKYNNIFQDFKINKEYVLEKFKKEQEQFQKVLEGGLEKLEHIKFSGNKIDADNAFELVTTYGLPFDIIKNYAEENDMMLDKQGYETKLRAHKEKSRNISEAGETQSAERISQFCADCNATEFVGYNSLSCDALVEKIMQGETTALVLDKTSFYAGSGGQCADKGYIISDGFKMKVTDVKKTSTGVFVHFGVIESGKAEVGEKVTCEVNPQARQNIANNHTSVHLLQSALQKAFGKNVHQAGSKVEEKKLRFDFNYDKPITDEEIFSIENDVNFYIRLNIPRTVEVKKLSDAIASGATALFENKYGDDVRVVSFGDISSELCGGTHTSSTGNIGLFIIVSTEGIGKGVRRITAITGNEAVKHVQRQSLKLKEIAYLLKVKPDGIIAKLQKDISDKNDKKSTASEVRESDIHYINADPHKKAGYMVFSQSDKKLSAAITKIADKTGAVVVCLAGTDKKQIIVAVGSALDEIYSAKNILNELLAHINGKGGGNTKVATGGTDSSQEIIIDAIKQVLQ